MAYKIFETEYAQQDLNDIFSYITTSLANPTAASAFADAVEECYGHLERMPLMFERCHDPRLSALGYRKAIINHYICIYRVDEPSETVNIMRFFYGRRDYEKLI